LAECYRALRTSILLSSLGAPPKLLLVTSALPQEGKSTTCVNLAAVLAQKGSRVLLVDGDLRRPSLHALLGVENVTGLTTLLTGQAGAETLVQATKVANLSAITSGPLPPDPAELLGSSLMKEQLARWATEFDHVIIDSPPALSVTDSVALSVEVDAVIIVVRAGQTTKAALRRVRDMLAQVNARLLGVALNAFDITSTDYQYYYYYRSRPSHYGRYYSDDHHRGGGKASTDAPASTP
jgi:capsular exopolysaccharide synthesis family protein